MITLKPSAASLREFSTRVVDARKERALSVSVCVLHVSCNQKDKPTHTHICAHTADEDDHDYSRNIVSVFSL